MFFQGGKPLVEVGVHILGNTLEVLGSTWKYQEVHGSIRKYTEVRGSTWKYVEVLGSNWKYVEVRGSTDIKQLLFNFIWSD